MTRSDGVWIGIDLGGTHLRMGVVEGLGVTWERRHAARLSERSREVGETRALGVVIEALEGALSEAMRAHPEARGVGLAIPGFLDPRSGRLASSPNLPGLVDVDLAGPLAARVGVPVLAENDALAAAWGERALHSEQPESLIYMGLGTGVGGGLVLEGRPYRGTHGMAMEVGHLTIEPGGRPCGCGNLGCLEQYASATGVQLSYRDAGGPNIDAREIARRARAGEVQAESAFEVAGRALGIASTHLMKVLDVTTLVIGGGLSAAWDLMEESFHERIRADLIPVLRPFVSVTASQSDDRAGIVGAALLARDRLSGGAVTPLPDPSAP